MQFKNYIFLIHCTIICNKYNFVIALVGPGVRQATPNEFPATVSIASRNLDPSRVELSHECTGALISKQDVITAAHCTRGIFDEPLTVLVGSHDIRNTIMYSPIYFWPYISWSIFKRRTILTVEHDIALIKIYGNAPDSVTVAHTWNLDNQMLFGMHAMVAGWGRINNGSIPRYLQTVSVKILSNYDCENKVLLESGTVTTINVNELCTVGDPYAILNGGDSGGPIFFFGILVGVNSAVCPRVQEHLQPYHVNIHMNIHYYYEYIQDTLNSQHINFIL